MTAFPLTALPVFIGTMQSSDCLQFICRPPLLRLSGIPLMHYSLSGDMETAGSPLLTRRHCTTWLTLDPAEPDTSLPLSATSVLPSGSNTLSALRLYHISGLKCLLTLSPNCLRLTDTVTVASPRLAIGGAAHTFPSGDSTRQPPRPFRALI